MKKYKRLSASEWSEARALWEAGDATLEELSARFGVTTRAFQRHFTKHGTKKGARAALIAKEIEIEVLSDVFGSHDERIERSKAMRASTFESIARIERSVMSLVESAAADPSEGYKIGATLRALSVATQTLERCFNVKTTCLALKADQNVDELPGICIVDLTEEEIAQMQNEQEDDDDSECIEVEETSS